MLTDPRLFDAIIVALFILAAIRWAVEGNWSRVTYWGAAAVLNVAILNMGK